jgi:hypothetical protein
MSTNVGIEFYGGYQVYSESGVDLTLLRENLKRTPTERVARNAGPLRLGLALRNSMKGQAGTPMLLEVDKLLQLLVTGGVEFVLIGGFAMRAHGSAHVTEDLDICYGRSPQNTAALVRTLASIHPYLRGAPPGLPFRFDEPTIQAGLNFTLQTDLGDLDVLGEVSGVGRYEQAMAKSVEITLFGNVIRVLSLDALIDTKRAAGRTKDRMQLPELEELKKARDAQS